MRAHSRILLNTTVTDGDFPSKLEAYRLGPLKHSDTETRIWYQLSANKDAQLPAEHLDTSEESLTFSTASSPASNKQLDKSRDVIVELKTAQLLEIEQKDDGYYCTVGLRLESKLAIDGLVAAAEYHLAANVAGAKELRLESPFRAATEEDLAGGIVERMLCKISVFAGRMTSTSIQSLDNKRVVGPGDSAAQLCKMAPLGYCNASIHLMGFWHNESAFSPVIYLTNAQLTLPALPPKVPPSARAVHSLADMPSLRTGITKTTEMSVVNPLRRTGLTSSPDMRTPRPISRSARSSQPLDSEGTYDVSDPVLGPSPASPYASTPSFRSSHGMASFMSQASTAEIFDSDEEEIDRDQTPPLHSPKKSARTTWVTCGPGANDWAMQAKGKAPPAFKGPMQLPGDKALRAHPNPTVRSLFKD